MSNLDKSYYYDNLEEKLEDDIEIINNAYNDPNSRSLMSSNLLKCLARKYKQKCQCDEECIEKLFEDIDFNKIDNFFDLDNLFDDDKYIDCSENNEVCYTHKESNSDKSCVKCLRFDIPKPLQYIIRRLNNLQALHITQCNEKSKDLKKTFDNIQCEIDNIVNHCRGEKDCEKISLGKRSFLSKCIPKEYKHKMIPNTSNDFTSVWKIPSDNCDKNNFEKEVSSMTEKNINEVTERPNTIEDNDNSNEDYDYSNEDYFSTEEDLITTTEKTDTTENSNYTEEDLITTTEKTDITEDSNYTEEDLITTTGKTDTTENSNYTEEDRLTATENLVDSDDDYDYSNSAYFSTEEDLITTTDKTDITEDSNYTEENLITTTKNTDMTTENLIITTKNADYNYSTEEDLKTTTENIESIEDHDYSNKDYFLDKVNNRTKSLFSSYTDGYFKNTTSQILSESTTDKIITSKFNDETDNINNENDMSNIKKFYNEISSYNNEGKLSEISSTLDTSMDNFNIINEPTIYTGSSDRRISCKNSTNMICDEKLMVIVTLIVFIFGLASNFFLVTAKYKSKKFKICCIGFLISLLGLICTGAVDYLNGYFY